MTSGFGSGSLVKVSGSAAAALTVAAPRAASISSLLVSAFPIAWPCGSKGNTPACFFLVCSSVIEERARKRATSGFVVELSGLLAIFINLKYLIQVLFWLYFFFFLVFVHFEVLDSLVYL